MILDHAYHGHLTSLVEISPYKFNNTGGDGKKDWVHILPVPDKYRGKYQDSKHSDDEICDLYVQEVIDCVERAEKKGRKICLFMAESLQSCGGQIIYPTNYLKRVHK